MLLRKRVRRESLCLMEAGGWYLRCGDDEMLRNETLKRAIHTKNILYTVRQECIAGRFTEEQEGQCGWEGSEQGTG